MKKDLRSENVKKIAEDFPMCITEIRDKDGNLKKVVDFEKFKDLFSDDIRDREEAYEFTWAGKREALRKAFESNDKILRPVVDDSLNFFDTQNIYIEGDNLDVLKILRRSYFEKVKMIYIDPPYNTGHDFIYKDDFKKSKEEYDEEQEVYDEEGNKLRENKESDGRFHSNWCSMIYSRLLLARDLLRPDGVIFISIDDNEVASLRKICDEVFGEDNFICQFVRKNKAGSGHDTKKIAIEFDYILCYAKNNDTDNISQETIDIESDPKYNKEDEFVKERGKYYLRDLDYKGSYSEKMDYPITTPDNQIIYSGGKFGKPNTWRWSKEKFLWGLENGYIVFKENKNSWKVYIKQYQFVDNAGNKYIRKIPYRALIDFSNGQGTIELYELMKSSSFSFPKPVSLMIQLSSISSPPPRLGRSRLNSHKKAILSSTSFLAPQQRHMLLCN